VRRVWRLIENGPASGPWNMGVDEALLRSAIELGSATLRIYRWQGPWLSLGYGQSRIPDALEAACRTAGVGIVRRSTGGRAVLHGGDLTYSIAAPDCFLEAGLRCAYDQIARALLAALHEAGIPGAERAAIQDRVAVGAAFDCFAEPAGDEICVAGRKLVGSAQRRSRGALLQHGSIRVRADSRQAREASGLEGLGSTSLDELGCHMSEEDLREALNRAFAWVLDAELVPSSLEPGEQARADDRVSASARDGLLAPRPGAH
jgi:lipoate-protein ligase A